jgi:hypothetical protein
MLRTARIVGLAALILALGAGSGLLPSVAGESPPEKVTTDTLAYCRQLAARVNQLEGDTAHPPVAVAELSAAGTGMCEHGSVRGGILRLRSAIVLLLHGPSGERLHAVDGD